MQVFSPNILKTFEECQKKYEFRYIQKLNVPQLAGIYEKGKKMESGVGMFGALEVAQRQYDIACEVKDYLKAHPNAAVVNLGCGLDDTFRKCDNGTCKGYNIDMPDVIAVRNELLPAGDREMNLGYNLNDNAWMDEIDASAGAILYATGVFYYFKTEEVRALFCKLAKRFPGATLVFDSCNQRGARMMTKTWLKEAGIKDVAAFFSLESPSELEGWSKDFANISSKSYMRGYRDIYNKVGFWQKCMIKFCDSMVKMLIVKIEFREAI